MIYLQDLRNLQSTIVLNKWKNELMELHRIE